MARDVNGTYTRVSNSFSDPVPGTTIDTTDATEFFDELETEMTDSLSRSGKGGMSADLDMNNNDINEIKTAVFQGSTSGNTTLQATAIAGTTTLTLPAATDTLVGKATTDTLTNKTFNSSGTGNTLQVSGVTVSAGQYPGETTTGSATAGNVGEYVEANLASGSAVSLTTGNAFNITSISLTAGDWDVMGVTVFSPATTTVRNLLISTLSATTGVLGTAVLARSNVQPGNAFTGASEWYVHVGPTRFSLSGTTTVYLVSRGDFTTSTMTAHGSMRARRVR